MSRLRPICRFVSPLADSRSTSRILRTDNLSAAIPSPGSKSAGKDGLRGEGVQRRRRQPAWSTSTETAGQLAPKRVVRFDRNGWSAWSETSGQIGAKYASRTQLNRRRADQPRANTNEDDSRLASPPRTLKASAMSDSDSPVRGLGRYGGMDR